MNFQETTFLMCNFHTTLFKLFKCIIMFIALEIMMLKITLQTFLTKMDYCCLAMGDFLAIIYVL